jgi:hypothetical protein
VTLLARRLVRLPFLRPKYSPINNAFLAAITGALLRCFLLAVLGLQTVAALYCIRFRLPKITFISDQVLRHTEL